MGDPRDLPGPSAGSDLDPVYLQFLTDELREDAYDYIDYFNFDLFYDLSEPIENSIIESVLEGGGLPPQEEADVYIQDFYCDLLPGTEAVGEEENLLEYPALRVTLRSKEHLSRFRLDTHVMEFRINPLPQGANPENWVELAFRGVYNQILKAGKNGMDRMCFTFNFANMKNNTAGWVSPRTINGYEFEDLWKVVKAISQSANGFDCADTFWIKLHVAEAPRGMGITPGVSTVRRKIGVVTISNEDNMCLPRALVVSKAFEKKMKARASNGELHVYWNDIRQSKGRLQRLEAERLTHAAKVQIPSGGCGLPEIQAYQRYLSQEGCAIIVYYFKRNGKNYTILYDGTTEVTTRQIPLELTLRIVYYPDENHYEVIKSMHSFLGSRYYCQHCDKPYSSPGHICEKICDRCLKNPPCDTTIVDKIICHECGREFHGVGCYNNHKLQGSFSGINPTVCSNIQLCKKCHMKIYLSKGTKHECCDDYKSHQGFYCIKL